MSHLIPLAALSYPAHRFNPGHSRVRAGMRYGVRLPTPTRAAMEDEMTEKEHAFRRDFQALLDKYGAEFHVQDHYQGYAECGQDIRVTISFDDPFQSFTLDNFYIPLVKP